MGRQQCQGLNSSAHDWAVWVNEGSDAKRVGKKHPELQSFSLVLNEEGS